MTNKKVNKLNNRFGKVYMHVLTNPELNRTDKLTYAVLSCKQGDSDYALLTVHQIADALGTSDKTIRTALNKLIDHEIIEKKGGGVWAVLHPASNNFHYGNVELAILASTNLPAESKLLFIYYRACTSTYNLCTRSRETIIEDLSIGTKQYNEAKKDLKSRELIIVQASSKNGHRNTDRVQAVILPEVESTMTWPKSWRNENDGSAQLMLPETISSETAINALDGDMGKITQAKGKNEHTQSEQKDTSNKNLKNHNKNLSLVANTAVTELHVEKFPRGVFSNHFYLDSSTTVEDDRLKLIIDLFTAIRLCVNRPEWRIDNHNFKKLDLLMDELGISSMNELMAYAKFLDSEIIANRTFNSFSYFVSDGIKQAYIAYRNANDSGLEFKLDDKTSRQNYQHSA